MNGELKVDIEGSLRSLVPALADVLLDASYPPAEQPNAEQPPMERCALLEVDIYS